MKKILLIAFLSLSCSAEIIDYINSTRILLKIDPIPEKKDLIKKKQRNF